MTGWEPLSVWEKEGAGVVLERIVNVNEVEKMGVSEKLKQQVFSVICTRSEDQD